MIGDPLPLLILRPASAADCRDLWLWRNDDQTRRMSLSTDAVPWDSHVAWFDKTLVRLDRMLYVGESPGGDKIGMCRFDRRTDGSAEIAINLNPACRGRGLSVPLLEAAIAAYRALFPGVLWAVIRRENVASLRCFSRCGFVLDHAAEGIEHYRLT